MEKEIVNIEGKEIEDENKSLAIYCMEHKDRDPFDNFQAWSEITHLLMADEYDHVTNTWVNLRDLKSIE